MSFVKYFLIFLVVFNFHLYIIFFSPIYFSLFSLLLNYPEASLTVFFFQFFFGSQLPIRFILLEKLLFIGDILKVINPK